MININQKVRANPEAECVWHKIAIKDYEIRNKLREGKPTFPKNNPCAMACNGYDFDCKRYDSIARQRFLGQVREIFGSNIKVTKLSFNVEKTKDL